MERIKKLLEKFNKNTENLDLKSNTNIPQISKPLKEYLDPNNLKPSKFAKTITHIQLNLYKQIEPLNLIEYKKSTNLSQISKHNSNLFLLVKNSPEKKYFFLKVLRKCLKLKNFNSFFVIYTALKNHLTKELNIYFEYDDPEFLRDVAYTSNKFFIPAFKIFYKDLEETSKSEIKSRNFCKSVEMYVRMQKLKNLEVKDKWIDLINKMIKDSEYFEEEENEDTRFLSLL